MKDEILIKEISEKLDINPKTIRFYEDINLIPKAKRNGSNYRVFSDKDIERISFVKKARTLGLSIEDIKKIIAIREGGDLPFPAVIDILEEQEKQLEIRIREMISFKEKISKVTKNFKENLSVCEQGKICGLIEILFTEDKEKSV